MYNALVKFWNPNLTWNQFLNEMDKEDLRSVNGYIPEELWKKHIVIQRVNPDMMGIKKV